MAFPDFLVIGAPKAGSTAVHQALVRHPQLFLSSPKELKYFLADRAVNAALRRTIRAGAWLGSFASPHAWRRLEKPLVATLRRERGDRPQLPSTQRRGLVEHSRDDIALLSRLLDQDFQDWLSESDRGTYAVRSS